MRTDTRIAEYVTYSDGVDRVTLGDELGLPMPTVNSAVARLLAGGALIETADTVVRSSVGRRPRVLQRAGAAAAFGVIAWRDGRLAAAVHDFAGGTLAERTFAAPDPDDAATGLSAAIAGLRRAAARRRGCDLVAVVVSIPAPFLQGFGAPGANAERPQGIPSFSLIGGGDLEAALSREHEVRVVMENDANLAGLGEFHAGAGRGVRNLVHLKLNEFGFGAALVVNGGLVRGAHGFAGELAHLQMDPEGRLCECGGRGCLGARVRAVVGQAARTSHPEPASIGSLSRAAARQDRGAARMLSDVGRVLARPVAHLCTFLDPDRVVVDAPTRAAGEYVLVGLRESVRILTPPAVGEHLDLRVGELGADAERTGGVELLRERSRSR